MKIFLLLITLLSTSSQASQFLDWDELESRLKASGGNIKALRHVQCFMEKGEKRSFKIKKPTNDAYNNRCYSKSQRSIGLARTFTLIDYTASSKKRRMFMIDRLTGGITTMAAAHGRYESGFFKRRLKHNHNTVKRARYYSNAFGSNAPSSGFYLTGHEYYGKWDRSLVLHGLEEGINDNACQRAVVIHGHRLVSKNKARVMSSGCPMVSKED